MNPNNETRRIATLARAGETSSLKFSNATVSTDFNEPTTRPNLKSIVRDVKTQAELTASQEVLAATKWNRRLAARQLNISY